MSTSKPKYRVDIIYSRENLMDFLNHRSHRHWRLVNVMARGSGCYEIVWEI